MAVSAADEDEDVDCKSIGNDDSDDGEANDDRVSAAGESATALQRDDTSPAREAPSPTDDEATSPGPAPAAAPAADTGKDHGCESYRLIN